MAKASVHPYDDSSNFVPDGLPPFAEFVLRSALMQDAPSKTALITGANKGIGFEIARQLGERGFHVFLTARDAERGKAVAAKLAKAGANITFLRLDVTDPRSVKSMAAALARKAEHLDVLVNNAAILENDDVSVLDV